MQQEVMKANRILYYLQGRSIYLVVHRLANQQGKQSHYGEETLIWCNVHEKNGISINAFKYLWLARRGHTIHFP